MRGRDKAAVSFTPETAAKRRRGRLTGPTLAGNAAAGSTATSCDWSFSRWFLRKAVPSFAMSGTATQPFFPDDTTIFLLASAILIFPAPVASTRRVSFSP